MRTTYDILLSLTVEHLYFSDKVFESFDLVPDKNTTVLLKNFKLVTKKKDNNWWLFFQTEGSFATTQPQLNNLEFLFTLKINDSSFYTITDDGYLPGRDEMLYFNSPLNSVIIPEKRKVYPLKFNYTIHRSVRPVNIKLTNYKGAELLNHTITDQNELEQPVNIIEENMYNISEDSVPSANVEVENIFAKELIDREPFYGTVYFKVLPTDLNPLANQYKINFETNN